MRRFLALVLYAVIPLGAASARCHLVEGDPLI
jgi:hypothetical protein